MNYSSVNLTYPSLTASSAISVSTGFFALDWWGNFRLSAPIPAGTAQGTQEEKSKMITKALLPRRNPAGPHGKDNTGTCGLPSPSPNSPWARPRPHHALPSQLPAPPWQNFWRLHHGQEEKSRGPGFGLLLKQSFTMHLLSTYCMPGSVLGIEDITEHRIDKNPCPAELTFFLFFCICLPLHAASHAHPAKSESLTRRPGARQEHAGGSRKSHG